MPGRDRTFLCVNGKLFAGTFLPDRLYLRPRAAQNEEFSTEGYLTQTVLHPKH